MEFTTGDLFIHIYVSLDHSNAIDTLKLITITSSLCDSYPVTHLKLITANPAILKANSMLRGSDT